MLFYKRLPNNTGSSSTSAIITVCQNIQPSIEEPVSRLTTPLLIPSADSTPAFNFATMFPTQIYICLLAFAGISTGTSPRPNCGRNPPAMPYHTGERYEAYKNTPYGWLGCNHNASASEAFHAFALKHQDEPDRLRRYLRLVEWVTLTESQSAKRGGGEGFAKLMRVITSGDDDPDSGFDHDPLANALALFFHPPSIRCSLDAEIRVRIGAVPVEACDPDADRCLLSAECADGLIRRTVGEFEAALRQTLRAVEAGDHMFLFG
jgi:hypothetical protein